MGLGVHRVLQGSTGCRGCRGLGGASRSGLVEDLVLTLGSLPGRPPPHCLEQSQEREEGLGRLGVACPSDRGRGRSGLGPGLHRDQRPAGPGAGKEPGTRSGKR